MKKLKRTFLLFALVLCLAALGMSIFTACDPKDGTGEDTLYSVSVELADGTGVSGVTVTFSLGDKEYHSSKTGDNGKVEVTLGAAEYDVTLSTLPAGYTSNRTSSKTNRLGSPLTFVLEQKNVVYSATVSLPDESKAQGVTVVWSKGETKAGEAETDAKGYASAELPADTYSVTIKNEPDGYWLEQAVTATEQNAALNITLQEDPRIKFTVTAKTEGGMVVRNARLYVLKGTTTVLETVTDKDGTATFRLPEDNYTLLTTISTAGLTLKSETSSFPLDRDHDTVELIYQSQVIDRTPPANKKYVLGDIMYDFTLNPYYDPDTEITLSELLQEKDLVVLNFWYTTCSWCVKEFPCLAEAYEEYKDRIEVIAVDPLDNATDIYNFHLNNDYLTFPLAVDTAGIASHFTISGYPTTVFIDRYGAVARIESGAIVYTELWLDAFEEFTAEGYRQTFTPGDEVTPPEEFVPDIPDVEMPASSEIEAAINNTETGCDFTYYPETGTNDAKYAWPFVVDTQHGKSVIQPANTGYRSSYSILHANMNLKAGDVVAFDFFSSCESSDVLYVLVDGLVLWQISGIAENWDTCFAYVAIKDGTYKLSLLYQKDSTVNAGDDAVYITNMRILSVSDINVQTDIIRHAATDMNEDQTAYNDYVTPVLGDDGYFHVDKADGPYLLADLLHSTHWNNKSIYELYRDNYENALAFRYDLDGDGMKEDCKALILEYISLATRSDSYGLVPVDRTLKALLDAITADFSENHHDKEWLEICKYFSRYGAEGEYPLPTLGLNMNTAIEIGVGTHTFHPNRVVFPVNSLVYKFEPTQSGVYLFNSMSESDNYQTQAWLYTSEGHEGGMIRYHGDDLLGSTADDDDGINFCIYAYLTAGETYYLECAFYWNDESTMGQSFDFKVEYVGAYKKVMTSAASGAFTTDSDDISAGKIILAYSIDTVLYEGKYYYKNSDGSRGSLIYIDVKTPTRANTLMSLQQMANSSINGKDEPVVSPFDFTQYEGLSSQYAVDYSERIKELIENPDERGYVEATEELVTILKAYAQVYLFAVDDAWLQFAYYEHEYGIKPDAEPAQQSLFVDKERT